MSAIKKFFEKRKLNVKFKKAGSGHRLDEPSGRPQTSRPTTGMAKESPRPQPVDQEAVRRAADAALARLNSKQNKSEAHIVRSRMRIEMESEKKRIEQAEAVGQAAREGPKEVVLDGSPMLTSILYNCPEIGHEVLPKEEMENHIYTFLLNRVVEEIILDYLVSESGHKDEKDEEKRSNDASTVDGYNANDPEMTSALMIHTLNKNQEKVKVCIDTLVKYLDNIISNPNDDKYRKIRIGNKVFQERIAGLQGTEEFLQAAGFSLRSIPHEGHEESFWILDDEMAKDVERLQNIKDVLLTAEPIKPQLDRVIKVFYPSNNAAKFEIPDEFYSVSPAELKKEQQRREEATEKLGLLRTKAMRERDEQRELRKYRFTLIRVRFPDGVLLQGVFRAHEKLTSLKEFVGENLINWLPFFLSTATGQRLTESNATLAELNLAPAAVVNFAWDPEVIADIAAQKGSHSHKGPYLKPELMALIQAM